MWYFKIVSNFTRQTAREITCNNFDSSLVVFMPNITSNHAITFTSLIPLEIVASAVAQGGGSGTPETLPWLRHCVNWEPFQCDYYKLRPVKICVVASRTRLTKRFIQALVNCSTIFREKSCSEVQISPLFNHESCLEIGLTIIGSLSLLMALYVVLLWQRWFLDIDDYFWDWFALRD